MYLNISIFRHATKVNGDRFGRMSRTKAKANDWRTTFSIYFRVENYKTPKFGFLKIFFSYSSRFAKIFVGHFFNFSHNLLKISIFDGVLTKIRIFENQFLVYIFWPQFVFLKINFWFIFLPKIRTFENQFFV